MPEFDAMTPQCFCRTLWQATRQATKLYESVLGPSGLKIAEFAILSEISRGTGDGLSLPELASRFLLDRSALRYRLLPMVRAGLVEVVEDERDRRGRRVRITPEGQARFAAAQPLWHEAQSRFEKALGADEALGLRTRARAVGAAGFADSFAALG